MLRDADQAEWRPLPSSLSGVGAGLGGLSTLDRQPTTMFTTGGVRQWNTSPAAPVSQLAADHWSDRVWRYPEW